MMTDEEIMEKGMKILDKYMGDLESTRFIAQIMQKGIIQNGGAKTSSKE